MKRDMDLVREILLFVESQPAEINLLDVAVELPGRDYGSTVGHIQILEDAGLLIARKSSDSAGTDWRVERLTWQGHEFIDSAKDDANWRRAKQHFGSKLGEVGLHVVKQWLADLAIRSL